MLLASECCRTESSAGKATTQHTRASSGAFVSGNLEKKGVAGSYYILLAYADLGQEQ